MHNNSDIAYTATFELAGLLDALVRQTFES